MKKNSTLKKISSLWLSWWRDQSPTHQDRLALYAPLTAVILFLAAIFSAFSYLHFDEIAREQESFRNDLEYTQQRIRLRVLERQEQSMRLADEINKGLLGAHEFPQMGVHFIKEFPELTSITWLSSEMRVKTSVTSAYIDGFNQLRVGEPLKNPVSINTFNLVKELHQSAYSNPFSSQDPKAYVERVGDKSANYYEVIQFFIPLYAHGKFDGVLITEFDLDGLLRFCVPTEVSARNAISITRTNGAFVAGQAASKHPSKLPLMPWSGQVYKSSVPLSPFDKNLELSAVNYRGSVGIIGNALFLLVAALSILTVWMLIGNWRHSMRRQSAQDALMAETNFRRAMENSMLTGMRAMDLRGKITYVNAAFCQMTGWSESELVGATPPFPYWPKAHIATLSVMLDSELKGLTPARGYQVKVQHKTGRIFDVRLYVSPLVDAYGVQTGWMTSMTDITEPNRIRNQLSAAQERFTTVLGALDASVSVTPLGSTELLFANKLYRLWFQNESDGHITLVQRAGMPNPALDKHNDNIDNLAGFPSHDLTEASPEHSEIFVLHLNKWLEVRARYLNWVDGRLAQMVIATDITARRNAEEQAKNHEQRAQASSRLITMGEMASSVAHELNQPLTAITNYCKGMTERINKHQIVESELLMALDKTAKQAQRAGQIIQRIKSFVKRSEPNQVQSDVITTTMEAIELAEIEVKRRRVRFTHYFGPRLPAVKIDRILIQQVLINLLKNAAESIDIAERENSKRHIDLNVNAVDIDGQRAVEFVVKDSGGGLTPKVEERLFEAFFSTKTEGLGIGLNLCRSIVESHQGRMRAQNLYNSDQIVGCIFSFWIPAMGSKADNHHELADTIYPNTESRSYS